MGLCPPFVVLSQLQHLVVILELELACLSAFKELDADFLADDASPDPVLLGQAQPHLLQDELNLFLFFH